MHTSVTAELISSSSGHNHCATLDQVEVTLLRNKMKERILDETTSIIKIYDGKMTKANLSKAASAIITRNAPVPIPIKSKNWN